MKSHLDFSEQKLAVIKRNVSTGLAEVDGDGGIIGLNAAAEAILRPILVVYGIGGDNFYAILERIAPSVLKNIQDFDSEQGDIIVNARHRFYLSFGKEKVERDFEFTVTRISFESLIICFDDVTELHQKNRALNQFNLDKAVMQGKYEIASNVLHDIGNALVGMGSYLNRIRSVSEQDSAENLKDLVNFFRAHEKSLITVFEEKKTSALIAMLSGLTDGLTSSQSELKNSVKEQQNIISHIQEILVIHRQYNAGNDTEKRESIDLRSLINDCMSMLMASLEKRRISVLLNVPSGLPILQANRTKFMQVMLNVLKNSMEAIDVNAPVKTISISVEIAGEYLVLQVQDSGHGFDDETGGRLFTRGFTTKASGSGLGLSHCRAIMECHGGDISISSEGFGKGAVVTITINIPTA